MSFELIQSGTAAANEPFERRETLNAARRSQQMSDLTADVPSLTAWSGDTSHYADWSRL
jgi:hypothetical protein